MVALRFPSSLIYLSHIELRMLQEMYEGREEERWTREDYTLGELEEFSRE